MTDEHRFADFGLWQAMLERASDACAEIATGTAIGLLLKETYTARKGNMVILRKTASGMDAFVRNYSGEPGPDVAVLLVLDPVAAESLQKLGFASARALVRQGQLQPYILKPMDQLEAAGMEDFIDDLGLTFPKH